MLKLLHVALLAGFLASVMAVYAESEPQEGIAYSVEFRGDRSSGIRKIIKQQASVCRLEDQPPITLGQLRYRIEQDEPLIESVLESEGYYDATFDLTIDTDTEPTQVIIDLELGPAYVYRIVEVIFPGSADKELAEIKPRLRKKQRVQAAAVFEEQERILDEVRRRGYPFPSLIKRTVNVNRAEKVVDVRLEFDPGVKAYFGSVEVDGLETLGDSFVRRQLPWEPGDSYDRVLVERLERRLLESGLFSRVNAEPSEAGAGSNSIPIAVELRERDKRTIQLGAGFSDIGPEVKAFWEHRSLFGSGERFETSVLWNPITVGGGAKLTRSGFLDANQYLVLEAEALREYPDAYDSRKLSASAMVQREFNSELWGGIGVGYRYLLDEQQGLTERYGQLFFPLEMKYDSRDDLLNPVSGIQLFGRTEFYEDTLGAESYLKSRVEARHYAMFIERFRLSSALRLCVGSIDGTSLGGIPAGDRFYAGGGGSVRGYEYQSIGSMLNGRAAGG
ncbi:MAG: BamA/TamA family outer membrane protein, partial [Pontiellaceae bacterium]|nr:BamA/TamA family outer membrane protein [Pontiellaceae bacterium]